MATLLSDTEILALSDEYIMGSVWESALSADKVKAANTIEAYWRTLPWEETDPFQSANLNDTLRYIYAQSARFALENQDSLASINAKMNDLLRPYLGAGIGEPDARTAAMVFDGVETTGTTTGTGTLTGAQIVALLNDSLGATDWQSGSLTGAEVVAAINTALGYIEWQHAPPAGLDIVLAIDTALGSTDWRTNMGGASSFSDLTGTLGIDQIANSLIVETKLSQGVRDKLNSSGVNNVVVTEETLPAPPVAMRMGWSQTKTMTEAVFVRADNHPTDGAALGTTERVAEPPFPPALKTEPSLYKGIWLAGAPNVAAIQNNLPSLPTNILSFLEDPRPLTVDGVEGVYYASSEQNSAAAGNLHGAVLVGNAIVDETELEPWANTANPTTPIPAAKLTLAPQTPAQTGTQLVDAIDAEIGNDDWQDANPTDAEIVTAINTELGNTDWQTRGGGASSFSDLTGTIAATQIPDDRIVRRMVNAGAIGTDELGVRSVTQPKVGNSAIGTDQLANDAVTNAKLSQAVRDAIAAGGGGGGGGGTSVTWYQRAEDTTVTAPGYDSDAVAVSNVVVPAGATVVVAANCALIGNPKQSSSFHLRLYRGSTAIRDESADSEVTVTSTRPAKTAGVINYIDTPAAGTYTYSLRVAKVGPGTGHIDNRHIMVGVFAASTGGGGGTPAASSFAELTGSIASSQIPAGLIEEEKLDVSNAPADGQLLSWDTTDGLTWTNAPTGTGGASSFNQLTGMIADSQIPASIARDTEVPQLASVADFAAAIAKPDDDGKFYYWTEGALIFEEVNDEAAAIAKPDDDNVFYFWTEAE